MRPVQMVDDVVRLMGHRLKDPTNMDAIGRELTQLVDQLSDDSDFVSSALSRASTSTVLDLESIEFGEESR